MSESELQLHQFEISPFAAKVRRTLYYKKIPFTVRNYALADMKLIQRTISSTGKTPVLEHRNEYIIDSTTILHYLETRYPSPAIYPNDARECALALILEDWADENLFFYDLTMRSWSNNIDWLLCDILSHERKPTSWLFKQILPKALRKITITQGLGRKCRTTICAEVAALFKHVDQLLESREFLMGSGLSIADIAVASMFTVLERAEEAATLMAQQKNLKQWKSRVDQLTFPPGTRPEEYARR